MWSPEVPEFFLNILSTLGGFFTIDLPSFLSSPDCVFNVEAMPHSSNQTDSTEGIAFTPIDKWYMELLLPFGFVLLIMVPCCFYIVTGRDNEDDVRKAVTWSNVCTQVSFVWIFATVVTTSLKIVDCDLGTEGRLIMDPSLSCPLAYPNVFEKIRNEKCNDATGRTYITNWLWGGHAMCERAAKFLTLDDTTAIAVSDSSAIPGCYQDNSGSLFYNTDFSSKKSCTSSNPCLCTSLLDPAPDAWPAVLGLSIFLIYCFGILFFTKTAIESALLDIKKRVMKYHRNKVLTKKAAKRKKRRKKREQGVLSSRAFNSMYVDQEEEAKDQKEIETEDKDTNNRDSMFAGWLMKDYKYPLFELWNGECL